MSGLKITVKNEKAVVSKMKQRAANIQKEINAEIDRIVVEAHSKIVKSLSGKGKTGRKYRRGKKFHTASAPGQAPATDTGALRGSVHITSRKANSPKMPATVRSVLTMVKYGLFLEQGVKRGKRNGPIAKRPFFGPVRTWVRQVTQGRLRKAAKRGAK